MSAIEIALAEIKEPLSPQELQVLKNQVDSEKPNVNSQSEFNYAWGLIKSRNTRQQQQGIVILRRLYKDVPSMRRECLYYLSLSCFKLGEYGNAKQYVDVMLKEEPHNAQALTLRQAIDDKVTREGLIGLGLAGGALAIGVGILSAALRKKR